MKDKRFDSKHKLLKKGERERKDGNYSFRWTDRNGKRQEVYASSLDDLRKQEEKIQLELIQGVTREGSTLNEQIERYFQTKVKLKKSTISNYRYYYNHIIHDSWLGQSKILDIKKSDILLFYRYLSEDYGLSAGTIKIIQKIIRPALQLAVDDDVLFKNPANGCTKDYTEEPEKKYALTVEESREFLDRILLRPRMKRYYPFYAILLKTGLRIGEAIGLTWSNVNFEERTITINHQIQCRAIDGKMTWYSETPKTRAGARTIPMTDAVYDLFIQQRKEWLKINKDPNFSVGGYSDFVFLSHSTGNCLQPNSVRRMMRNLVSMNDEREIQLPPISPHILRHTAITRLAEAGCEIKVLQYVFGQSDIRVTMQVYNHVNKDRVSKEIARLEGKVG